MSLSWNAGTTPSELIPALEILQEDYVIGQNLADGTPISFSCGGLADAYSVTRDAVGVHVQYGSRSMAMRAVGSILAGLAEGDGHVEERRFSRLGIMLDCSRNAVMKVSHFKMWLRRLALMGYNEAMLYTEDTYVLPGEDYFGYMRGAYTLEEMQEVDQYADALGIEMIPCIQTLGHLGQIMRWSAHSDVKDTPSVLLVDEPKTYKLIEKMLDFWAAAFKTRRIHIGMDETHDLGRGRFMDQHGYESGFDIFNRHLQRVVGLSTDRGYEPMIWSDMYFRMGSKTQNYYDKDCVIPQEVADAIPREVQLVYWDYYKDEKAFYLEWIQRHRDLGFDPIMGSGVWTWTRSRLWHDRELTEITVNPCVEACREKGVKEIFFTLWGDDGATCDFDSALAGLAFSAEKCFGDDMSNLKDRFSAVCLADYDTNQLPCRINSRIGADVRAAPILWDDPIYNIYLRNRIDEGAGALEDYQAGLLEVRAALEQVDRSNTRAGRLEHAYLLTKLLIEKVEFGTLLCSGYKELGRSKLESLKRRIPGLVDMHRAALESFRDMWLTVNKPFGLDVVQRRLGGVLVRYEELDRQLGDYLAGKTDSIEELDVETAAFNSDMQMNYGSIAASSMGA